MIAGTYGQLAPEACCTKNEVDKKVSSCLSFPQGYYFSGDGCRRDEDGFYWVTGRVDDVINVR